MPQLSARSVAFCRALARAICAAVGLVGLAVLAGWIFNVQLLKSIASGWATMKPNTALALLLAAGALWPLTTPEILVNRRWRWLVRAAAGGVILIGALTLAENAFELSPGIDGLLFREAGGIDTPGPERMSPLAAIDLLLLGSALLLIASRPRPATVWTTQLGSLVAAFGAFIAVTGYLYGPDALHLASFFTSTALHTAAALLALSVGVACARPTDGLMALFNSASAGGTLLRRLLLPIVLLPVAINWVELEGERRGVFPASFGWMLDAALTVVLIGALVWIVARIVHEKDVAREVAETALRRSEERYRQLIEMSPVAIIVKDQRRIEFANPAARALVGATQADEVLGKSPFAFVHPESRAKFEKEFCRVLRDGTPLPLTEQRVIRLDGKEVDIEFSASAVDYHGQRFAQVVASDITERKLSALALRASEERFRLIAETVTEVFWMADVKLERIVYVSPAYERIWGLTCASLYENPRSFLDAVHPDDRARVLADLDVEKQALPFDHEYRVVQPDGDVRWVWDRGYPVHNGGSEVLHYVGVAQDITERKRIDDALRSSVERLQLLARVTGDAIWDWDVVNDATWWSEAFVDKFGYAPGTVPSFAGWIDHVHPEDRKRAAEEFDEVVARKAVAWTSEYRFRLADGSYGIILDRVYGMCDASGKLVRMIGSMVDITAVRRVEEQARLLAQAVESSSDLISITSLDDRFMFVNRAFLQAYGYTSEEVLGRTPSMLAPANEDSVATIRPDVLAGGWSGELVNQRKDKTKFALFLNASPVRDTQGQVVALIGVGKDITERRAADEILRASEERFRAMFEQAAIGMSMKALDGRLLRINEKVCRITGYSSAELLARSVQDITHPDDLDVGLQHMRRLLAGESATYTIEKRYVRKDRSVVWVEVTASLVRRSDGSPDYFIALIEDITQRRNLETQLRQVQKMEAIGQLAGGVAHDFNNMLTAIQGHVTLMGMAAALPTPARESLDEIMKASKRAASLTRQLLLFSRREVMQPARMNLNDTVTSITKMLQRLIGEDVRIRLQLHPRPLPVHADTGMIDQVLMNLAVNARDAMPRGGDLIIETEEKVVDAEMARLNPEVTPGRYVCLSVSDTGSGIPVEVLPRIFEPFFTTKEVGKGTGLGLATVFGIVKQHRGWAKVYSEVGRGTTFRVFLPLIAITDAPPQIAAPPTAPPRGQGETVLLVEDDASVRTMTEITLERSGYRVLSAATGDDALREWERHAGRVDLLLTDLVMPGQLGGRELALELQTRKPGLAVIFVSGYSAEIAGRELSLGDRQTFLQKPFEVTLLLKTIYQFMETREQA